MTETKKVIDVQVEKTPEQLKKEEERLKKLEKSLLLVARDFQRKKSDIETIIKQVIHAPDEYPVTISELRFFLESAKQSGLSPYNNELWAYKDNKGNLLIFAGKNGFLKMAHDKDPNFKSVNSHAVYSKDEFRIEYKDGKQEVYHIINPSNDRGTLLGAYAIYENRIGGKAIEYASLKDYDKDPKNTGYTPWKTHKEEMIKKVALVHVCKLMVSIGGIYDEAEFRIDKSRNMVILDEENDGNYSDDLREEIKKLKTIEEVNEFYNKNKTKYKKSTLDKLITEKRNELKNL